jgi:16S rRNA (guanine527-N7)-methyltransferase
VTGVILKYFHSLSETQISQLASLKRIYEDWNSKINVISRKDMDNFYIHHVLHSLAIAKIIQFRPGTRILDVGTGGGFPGIPLAIVFPESEFFLLDSVEKKIKVAASAASGLKLSNVKTLRKRAEEETGKYDFVVNRAVMQLPEFVKITGKNIEKRSLNDIDNGIISLKGGDLGKELLPFQSNSVVWEIRNFFNETYFETKKIVYLPL